MSKTVKGVHLSGTVYRNQSRVLFTDDGDDRPMRRTWVSARIDRSQWAPEHDRGLFDVMPDRGGGVARERVAPVLQEVSPRSKRPDPRKVFTDEEVLAVKKHGHFEFVELMHSGNGTRTRRQIKARCVGGFCNGHISWFHPHDWVACKDRFACPKCHREIQVHARLADRLAKLPNRHGLYEFVGVTEKIRNGLTRKMVVARCTGPACGGHERMFEFASWDHSTDGLLGCNKCSAPIRTRTAGQRGKRKAMALLDAAAAEMRRLDSEVAA